MAAGQRRFLPIALHSQRPGINLQVDAYLPSPHGVDLPVSRSAITGTWCPDRPPETLARGLQGSLAEIRGYGIRRLERCVLADWSWRVCWPSRAAAPAPRRRRCRWRGLLSVPLYSSIAIPGCRLPSGSRFVPTGRASDPPRWVRKEFSIANGSSIGKGQAPGAAIPATVERKRTA